MANNRIGTKQGKTHYVEMTDDCGTVILVEGTLRSCVEYVRSCFPEINAADFSATWNAANESGSVRFCVGAI